MKTNPEYRAEARRILGGNIFSQNWLMALVAVLIIGAISGALAATGIGSIAWLLIYGSISVGLASFMLTISRENKAELGKLFEPFSQDFTGTMLLGIMFDILIMLWTLLFIVPGIVKSYAYSMCFYIKKDNPDMDWSACLKESMRMTDGHKAQLSFWISPLSVGSSYPCSPAVSAYFG